MIRDTYMSPAITFIFELDPDSRKWVIMRGRHRIREGWIPAKQAKILKVTPDINYDKLPDVDWYRNGQHPGHETVISDNGHKPILWYSPGDAGNLSGDWNPDYDPALVPHDIQTFMICLEQAETACLLHKAGDKIWDSLAAAYHGIGRADKFQMQERSASAQSNCKTESEWITPGSLHLPPEELCETGKSYILPDDDYDPYNLIRSQELQNF